MTSTTASGSEPDDARLREALRLASVPPSDDVGPANGPGAAGWDIATTADRLGVSAHTLRYYERIGLVQVKRDTSGYRRYDAAGVRRLVFLTRMRTSGMSIRDLQRYVDMVKAGRDTVPERLTLLIEHRDGLRARIDEAPARAGRHRVQDRHLHAGAWRSRPPRTTSTLPTLTRRTPHDR